MTQSKTVAAWTCPKCGEEFVVVPDQATTHERLCDGPAAPVYTGDEPWWEAGNA